MNKRSENVDASSDPLMNLREAARFLRLSPGTLYQWVERRKVPFIRLGTSRIRFRRQNLEEFLRASTVAADSLK